MAKYGDRYGGMSRPMPKGGKKIGDGMTATSPDKSWSSGTGNVKASRLNTGGDRAYKGKRSKVAGKPKKMAY